MKSQRMFFKSVAAMIALVIFTMTVPSGAGASNFKPAPAPGSPAVMQNLTPEQVEAAVEEYFDAVGAFDVQRYVNNFAADGVLEDPVGTPPVQGSAALTA